ncbi:MAG: DUF4126 family protein [Thermoleophilia bacterium]|nr:DUF4126 family protein [Thermoleophilia bacterium]
MAIAWAIGAGIGLSSLAGFRAFLPVAVFMFMSRLGWSWGIQVEGTSFDFLTSNLVIVILLALVVLEVLLTRVGSLVTLERMLRLPLAAAAGALLFTAALAGESAGSVLHFLGIPLGLGLAWLGYYVYRGLMHVGEGRDPGPALDLSVVVLSVLMMLLPPAGFFFGALTAWLALRVRKLKRMKYKGLRVLA